MTTAQVEADIQDAYDTNHGGLEIGQTSGNSTVPRSIGVWKTVYEKANSLGMKISQKVVGSLAPDRDNTPTTYTNYSDYARRTLEFGTAVVVNPGTDLVNYDVSNIRGTTYPTIVSVLAYQCTTDPCTGAGTAASPYVVDRTNVLELTDRLTGTDTDGYENGTRTGTLNWTNGSELPYVIKVIRAVPYGSNNTPETLSKEGTDLITASYDEWFGAPVGDGRTLGDLVKENGGDFFVDSHGSDPWGVPYELWSSNLRADFRAAKGYDILTNIVALEGTSAGSASGVGTQSIAFSDGSMRGIANDFYDLRNQLFSENRITRFQTWANKWKMSLRIQHEDANATNSNDQAAVASYVDRNEYESLIADDNHDAYRQMASGMWMTGNQWFSTECCAISGGGFLEDVQDTMIRMSKEFAGGVDRPVYHVRGAVGGNNTTWPGGGHTNTTKNGWAGYYSSIQPYHENFADINDYYARNGMVLRTGQIKVDVAVYMVDYVAARNTSHWTDTSLQEAGYTWGYLNDTLMSLDNAKVTNGVLAEDGPGYKAMVFNQYITPDGNAAKGTLTSSAAKKMLGYARAGLPIIFVGEPTGVPGLSDSNDTLATQLAALYALPNVYRVNSYAELTAKLKQIGVEPNLKPETDTHLLSINRYDEKTDTSFYWIHNYGINLYQQQNISSPTGSTTQAYLRIYENETSCFIPREKSNSLWDRRCIKGTGTYAYSDNPISASNPGTWIDYNDDLSVKVSLLGDGVPYLLNTYNGEITPITDYERVGDRVELTTKLAVDDSMVIALGSPTRFGGKALGDSAVETTAAFTRQVGSDLVVAANAAGTYTTTLSGGDVIDTTITEVPEAIDLSSATWELVAEDWQPAAAYGTVGWAGSATTKHTVTASVTAGSMTKYSDRGVTPSNEWAMQEYEYLTDDGMLPSWYHIDGLKYASGVGTYTTTVDLAAWDPSWVAMLNLGEVFDSFTVTVNGTTVPFVNQVAATADIGPYLKAGANTLSVRVTTTLNNRLYQLGEAIATGAITSGGAASGELIGAYTRGVLTHYGLIGPVTVTPYATAVVAAAEPVDAALLQTVIDIAASLEGKLDGFTDATVGALAEELGNAKAVLADPASTQEQVDAAVSALQAAIAGLRAKPAVVDKAVLQSVFNSVSALSNADGRYTTGSWSALQAGIVGAKAVLDDPSATQEQIDAATTELSSALADLVPAPPVVAKVKLNQSQLRLAKGKSLTLAEGVYYANGVHPAYSGKAKWKSSNTKVATVSANGTVKAKKPGTATITVTSTDVSAAGKKLSTSIKVTVVKSKGKAKVTKVSASVPKTMTVGQSVYITGKYSSAKATGVKVTYTSSKTSVVAVDAVGRLVAQGKGTAKITVKAGGKSKTYKVTVK